jgi:hypothetical protein
VSLVHNERTKLMATGLNNLAVGVTVAGGVSPLIALFYGFSANARDAWVVAILTVVWFSTGALTYTSSGHSWEAEAMTAFEIFAVFGVPAMLLALGGLGYLLVRHSSKRER